MAAQLNVINSNGKILASIKCTNCESNSKNNLDEKKLTRVLHRELIEIIKKDQKDRLESLNKKIKEEVKKSMEDDFEKRQLMKFGELKGNEEEKEKELMARYELLWLLTQNKFLYLDQCVCVLDMRLWGHKKLLASKIWNLIKGKVPNYVILSYPIQNMIQFAPELVEILSINSELDFFIGRQLMISKNNRIKKIKSKLENISKLEIEFSYLIKKGRTDIIQLISES